MRYLFQTLLLIIFFLTSTMSFGDQSVSRLLVEEYAEISLAFDEDSELEAPLQNLLRLAEQNRDADPGNASAWVAVSRIRFGYANTQGPLRGMRLMKEARDEMEKAIAIDPTTESGSPQAFLGYLYAGVPSWPISFGDKRTSEKYFDAARSINAESLELKYFIAVVAAADGETDLAISHLASAKEMLGKWPAASSRTRLYERSILRLLEDLSGQHLKQ